MKSSSKGLLALSAASLLLLASCGGKKESTLNLYNWNDYINPEAVPMFEEQTGINVNFDHYDANETVEAKLVTGNSGYDLVVPSATFVERFIKADLLQKIDKSKIPNLANVDENIMSKLDLYDPGTEYSVNYMWGTTALGFNKTKVDALLPNAPHNSWQLILDPKNAKVLQKCGITMVDSPEDVLPNIVNYLGKDPNDFNEEDYMAAKEVLMKIRPYIKDFNSTAYINDLANGEICLSIGYNGDILQARDRAAEAGIEDEIVYSIPKEGALIWLDNFVIPSDAKNVDEAHAFINYYLSPEVTAAATNYVFYANSNKAATEFLDEEIKNDPGIYPPEEVMAKLFATKTPPEEFFRVLTSIWTEVKTGAKSN